MATLPVFLLRLALDKVKPIANFNKIHCETMKTSAALMMHFLLLSLGMRTLLKETHFLFASALVFQAMKSSLPGRRGRSVLTWYVSYPMKHHFIQLKSLSY